MKTTIKISFFIILCFVNSSLYAQLGCRYNGDYNAILSEVKSRNNNAPTEEDKLTDTEAKKVAKYWELDCKCRKGVSSQQEAQELANEAFLNTSNNFTKGMGVNERKKDLGYLGDLKTPFAVFTPGSCMGSGDNFGSDFESNVNCAPEASRIKNLDGQLGAYASTFFMAYCKCKAGVSSQEEANALIAQMKTNHQNFNNMRNGATQPLSTQPLTSCNIVSVNGNDISGGSGQNKKLINDEWMGMLNDLAANSENEVFKEMVGDINNFKGGVNQLRQFTDAIPDLNMGTALNDLENVTTGMAIAGSAFDLLFGEKNDEAYKLSQKEAGKKVKDLADKINLIYKEIIDFDTITYEVYNEGTLRDISEKLKKFDMYKKNTAKGRLLYLKYVSDDFKPLPTVEKLNEHIKDIDMLSTEEAVAQADFVLQKNRKKFLYVHPCLDFNNEIKKLETLRDYCLFQIKQDQVEATKSATDVTKNIMLVKEVLLKYIDAIGGEQMINKVKTIEMKQKESVSKYMYPDISYTKAKAKGFVYETMERGTNTYAKSKYTNNQWEDMKMHLGVECKRISYFDTYNYLNDSIYLSKIRFEGIENIGSKKYNVLSLPVISNDKINYKETQKLYYDVETGLLFKIVYSRFVFDVGKTNQFEIKYENYKNIDGVLLPHKINGESVKYTINPSIDKSLFELQQE